MPFKDEAYWSRGLINIVKRDLRLSAYLQACEGQTIRILDAIMPDFKDLDWKEDLAQLMLNNEQGYLFSLAMFCFKFVVDLVESVRRRKCDNERLVLPAHGGIY